MHKIFGKRNKSKDNLVESQINSTGNDGPRPAETNSTVPDSNGTTPTNQTWFRRTNHRHQRQPVLS